MTIDEAIERSESKAACTAGVRGQEQAEIARWLRELRARRETGDTAYQIEFRQLQRELPDLPVSNPSGYYSASQMVDYANKAVEELRKQKEEIEKKYTNLVFKLVLKDKH